MLSRRSASPSSIGTPGSCQLLEMKTKRDQIDAFYATAGSATASGSQSSIIDQVEPHAAQTYL